MTMFVSPFTAKGTLFGKGPLPALERKISFLEERHKVIAHNIANVHTRFYKTKDLAVDEFDQMLRDSMEARDQKHVRIFEEQHAPEVYKDWSHGREFDIKHPALSAMRHGDNNVDIDREVAKMSRNQAMFKSLSRLAKKHYDLLRSTIRETP